VPEAGNVFDNRTPHRIHAFSFVQGNTFGGDFPKGRHPRRASASCNREGDTEYRYLRKIRTGYYGLLRSPKKPPNLIAGGEQN
jgi:hypothetical protein